MDSTLGIILIVAAVVLIGWAIFRKLFRVAIIAVVLIALGAWVLLS